MRKLVKKKVKVTVSVDEDLMKWVNEGVSSRKFGSTSHAMNLALSLLRSMDRYNRDIMPDLCFKRSEKTGEVYIGLVGDKNDDPDVVNHA